MRIFLVSILLCIIRAKSIPNQSFQYIANPSPFRFGSSFKSSLGFGFCLNGFCFPSKPIIEPKSENIFKSTDGQGRIPERIDHMLCKVQMFNRLDKIQEMEDPKATVEAYFNKTGYVCKTYCRIRSFNKELNKIFEIFDAPYYLICGTERFCGKGGKCIRIGTPLKLEEPLPKSTPKESKEAPVGKASTTNTTVSDAKTQPVKSTEDEKTEE